MTGPEIHHCWRFDTWSMTQALHWTDTESAIAAFYGFRWPRNVWNRGRRIPTMGMWADRQPRHSS